MAKAVGGVSRVERPFVRIYYVDLQRDYRQILYDPTAFSTYVRLLILADQAWPAMPVLPKAVRRADLAMLTTCGLIATDELGIYTVKGYHKERAERAKKAADAVAQRVDRQGTEVRTPVVPTYNDSSTTRAQAHGAGVGVGTGTSEEGVQGEEPDAANSLFLRTARFPSEKTVEWLNELAEAHSEARLIDAIDSTPLAKRNVKDYLVAIRDQLRAQDHAAEKAERADELRRNAAKRAPVKSLAEREAEYRAQKAIEAELMGGPA